MLIIFGLIVFVSSFLFAAVAAMVGSVVMEGKQPAGADGQLDPGLGDGQTILKLDQLSSISLWGNLLSRFDFVEGMRARITQAGLSWSVGRLTAMMLLAGASSLLIFSGFGWLPFGIAFLLACGAASLPYLYVLRRRGKRFRQFEEQFPDALDFLARSLRAGHPLPISLEMLAQEEAPPLATEMRTTAEERKLGMPLDQALSNLAKRMPLLNVRLFVAAVKMQSRTGGRLGEVLGGLAETMRESTAVQGEVRSLAAHGRATGMVLTALPIGIAIMMEIVNPGYLDILVESPTGREMVVVCLVALVAAHFVIRKIVDVRL